jgi:hypothetical protein
MDVYAHLRQISRQKYAQGIALPLYPGHHMGTVAARLLKQGNDRKN